MTAKVKAARSRSLRTPTYGDSGLDSRPNPWSIALQQLRQATDTVGMDEGTYEVLATPRKMTKFLTPMMILNSKQTVRVCYIVYM